MIAALPTIDVREVQPNGRGAHDGLARARHWIRDRAVLQHFWAAKMVKAECVHRDDLEKVLATQLGC
jgi:hypothetical protein